MTDNQSTANAARAERQRQIEEKVTRLRCANPELRYDTLFQQALAALPAVVAAMHVPADVRRLATANHAPDKGIGTLVAKEMATRFQHSETANGAADETAGRKVLSHRFLGLVKTAQHQRGISFQEAWDAIRAEQPDLWMLIGGEDAAKRAQQNRAARTAA